MSAGELCARQVANGQTVQIVWSEGVIRRIEPAPDEQAGDRWIAPTLVDLQINGFAGIDFQQDGLTVGQLETATNRLQAAGCGRYLLTLITAEWELLMRRLRHLRALRNQSPLLQAAIAGWHMEGPFLSPEPGFCGTHNPAWMCDPTPEQMRELRDLTESDPVLVTLAPERTGTCAAIEQAVALGLKVSLGHTNASSDQLREAVRAGATGFTHLGNGCPQALDRHDNILWRVLEIPELTVSLIPDRVHVSPALFRLVHRLRDPQSIYYTTDAMAAAGMPAGRYTIGPLTIEVGRDQVVWHPGKTHFAGSALTPFEGIFRAAEMLGCSWQQTWAAGSRNPARFMGGNTDLAAGDLAGFCLMESTDTAKRPNKFQVCVNGTWKLGVGGS